MRTIRGRATLPMLFLCAALALAAATSPGRAADPENTVWLDLEWGRAVIEMRPDLAPRHVKRIRQLIRQKFYDGLVFHRVIDGFMAQTGDPRGDGTGGSGVRLPAEFSKAHHVRGTVSMARARDPDSADSQFFIMFAPAPFLDRKYTIWGRVVKGMEHIDRIRKGPRAANGRVDQPDRIVRMRIAADAKK